MGRDLLWNCKTLFYVIAKMGRNLIWNCKTGSGSALELQNPILRYNYNPTSADICILIICKNRSGSALKLQNPIPRNCKNGSESFLELHYWVGICFGIAKFRVGICFGIAKCYLSV